MVQQFGLELLHLADGWASGRETDERLRLALVAGGADARDVFADRLPEPADPARDADVDFDYSVVDWQEDASADEWTRMQDALASSRVAVTSEPDHGEGSDTEVIPEVPDVDFDREWQ